jgi:adenosylhomocysteine nucleosidase
MIGVIFATAAEAQPFLQQTCARPIDREPFALYTAELFRAKSPCLTIISGMGKVAAAVAAHSLIGIHHARRLINVGLCGALADSGEWGIGKVVCITSAMEGDREELGQTPTPQACTSEGFADLPPARLITCDRPVFDLARKQELAALGEVVDMEGAAVARVAAMFERPCSLIKGVSDFAEGPDRRRLAQNLAGVSLRLAEALEIGLFHLIQQGR